MKVVNWDKWQSYRKDRGTPPWIKVYRNLLSNEGWVSLSDSEKGQLVSIWILAADKGGVIPDNAVLLQRMCMLDEKPNISKFKSLGFIDSCGEPSGNQVVTSSPHFDALETETETETYREETEKELSVKKPKKSPMDLYIEISNFDKFWDAYGKIGNKQQAIKSYNKSIKEGASHEEILGGLTNYQSQCQANNTEQRFIKHASTWLNNRGWEDDYTIHKSNGTGKPTGNDYAEAAVRGMLRAENPDF